jgi:D-alanine transaminase
MAKLAYLNGEILPVEKASVPVEDRGYQFGDAVYEFIQSFNGRLFCLEPHLDRLERSLAELDFPPVSRKTVRQGIEALFDRAKIKQAGIYIQISRGVQPREHAYADNLTPQIVMTIADLEGEIPAEYQKGIAVRTTQDYRWGRCDIKTVQLLPAALEKRRAMEEGLADTIFISPEGMVREATAANAFAVIDGRVLTHPLDEHILPGITRSVVLALCRELDLPHGEKYFTLEELYGADEAFLTATVLGILPVIRVDGHPIAGGVKGSKTHSLQEAFKQKVEQGG